MPSAPEARASTPVVPELQLAITRTGIGLELSAPVTLGFLSVREINASLPRLRFPVDVSGGVARFRHRRGLLERVVLEASRTHLEAWASPRLRGVLGVGTPKVVLLVRRGGASVGVVDMADARGLAFEVELDTVDDDVAVSIHDARGAHLAGPATLLALRVVEALTGGVAERHGARFVFRGVSARVARHVFPDRGARAPDASGLVWTSVRGHDDAWILLGQRAQVASEPSPSSVVAREGCALAEPADDAALALDLEKARTLLVDALERAPRHRELSRRLAEIDRELGAGRSGRAEAALATLRDAERDPAGGDGLLVGQLLEETGDTAGAIAAFARAGQTEPIGPLAALAYDAAARLTEDAYQALTWLDGAVSRAPALPGPRWRRLALRLKTGRVDDARADAEHLEALSNGSRARHAVWQRAGDLFRDAGFHRESAALFERALRYGPRDAHATAGLGAALVAVGKVARGAELLTNAITLAEAEGVAAWRAHIDLAAVLADKLDDKPAAIARVHDIPPHAREAVLARGLEGRWRGALGDLAGASLAFARARDLVEARGADLVEGTRLEALSVLLEGATLEGETKGDWLAAQRHLGTAIRLAPHDETVRAAFRDAGHRVAGLARGPGAPKDGGRSPESAPTWTGRPRADAEAPASEEAEVKEPVDEARDHARVEDLTRKLQADPTDDSVVDELSTCLLRLGRTHELFALLSARLDEAGPDRREALLPKQREVLGRLEEDARAAGRTDEANLYREAAEFL